jgi:hypothetical protein
MELLQFYINFSEHFYNGNVINKNFKSGSAINYRSTMTLDIELIRIENL